MPVREVGGVEGGGILPSSLIVVSLAVVVGRARRKARRRHVHSGRYGIQSLYLQVPVGCPGRFIVLQLRGIAPDGPFEIRFITKGGAEAAIVFDTTTG